MVSVDGVGKVESRINIVQKLKGVEGLVRVFIYERGDKLDKVIC